MLPVIKSCTEYTTPSGNTQIYIIRKQKKKRSARQKHIRQQKLLGLALMVVSIIAVVAFPKECGDCIFLALMGLARVACD